MGALKFHSSLHNIYSRKLIIKSEIPSQLKSKLKILRQNLKFIKITI